MILKEKIIGYQLLDKFNVNLNMYENRENKGIIEITRNKVAVI